MHLALALLLAAATGTPPAGIQHEAAYDIGALPFGQFALAVAAPGDVDGDGRADVMVYARTRTPLLGGPYRPGAEGVVFVYSGVDGRELHRLGPFSNPSIFAGSYRGSMIDGAGDLNGDGHADLLVGDSSRGRLRSFSGLDGAELFAAGPGALGPEGTVGFDVAGVGDVDGDGVGDLLSGYRHPFEFAGAYLFSGADGAALRYMLPPPGVRDFGAGLDGMGDLDGDGLADVVLGALHDGPWTFIAVPPFLYYKARDEAGAVRAYSGFDGSPLWHAYGDDENEQLGALVANAGDVDGDGVDDVVTGSVTEYGAGLPDDGYVRVLSGRDGAELFTFLKGDAQASPLASVDGAGDLNQDGHADVLVASPYHAGPHVRAFSGADGASLFEFTVPPPRSLARVVGVGLGDVNGDAVPDFAVGVCNHFPIPSYVRVFVSQ